MHNQMNQNLTFALLFISFVLILDTTKCDEDETLAKDALLKFIAELSNNNSTLILGTNSGWNSTSDPCEDNWLGVTCNSKTVSVEKIILDGYNFTGTFDANTICNVESIADILFFLSLKNDLLQGENMDSIDKCKHLTHLFLGGNRFSGSLSQSFSRLNNLKKLDISNNELSGVLPDLSRISGLMEFEAQNNQLSGEIPEFDFSNFVAFNVSFNNFSGLIPPEGDQFPISSYIDNPLLCGAPLATKCSSLPEEADSGDNKPKRSLSRDEILMFSGYILIGLALVLVILLCVYRKRKQKQKKKELSLEAMKKVAAFDHDSDMITITSMDQSKKGASNSGFSSAAISSDESNTEVSQSLVVLTSPEVNNGLRFENLLKAPAELLGRGKHGSVYKVMCDNPKMTLAVKRIKDWSISGSEFKKRMQKLDQIRHPNVLPAVAFYSSRQEKLLVYEYQNNGSLLQHLQRIQTGQTFDWSSRLSIAAGVADALAFMHQELQHDGIPHGNLKSSNILLNKNMEPRISEYGLMSSTEISTIQNQTQFASSSNVFPITDENAEPLFKADIYAFGVILLELLTGKVQNNGLELASWVVSVLREEWTVEVFDRTLIQEVASEERMVNLLQVAVKCVNHSPQARPSINQVALMITTIRDEDDRSIDVSASTSTII
nr:probable inactive receptor kinase At2g26730 [Nicotiana tomentosiformis]